jgi:hypothetical protein
VLLIAAMGEKLTAAERVVPLGELPNSRLHHLIGMKACIFAQNGTRERGDQLLRRLAELEMPCNELCREIDLSLPVEGVEQGGADCLNIGGQVVELLAVLARNASRRHIEITSKIERKAAYLANGVFTSQISCGGSRAPATSASTIGTPPYRSLAGRWMR